LLNSDLEEVNICTEYDAECAPEAWISSSPGFSNFFKDRNRAHSGEYCLALDAGHFSKPFFRSFIRTPLLCGLRAGQSYRVSFYLKSPHPALLDSVGFYFGEIDPLLERKPVHRLAPSGYVQFPTARRNDSAWQKVELAYVANGREAFFQLAYFGINDVQGSTGIDKEARFQIFVDDIEMYAVDPAESICANWQERKDSIYGQNARHEFLKRILSYRRQQPSGPLNLPLTRIVKVDTLILPDILFETGEAVLAASQQMVLDSLCRQQQGRTIDSVRVEGHTDDTGPDSMNQRLSGDRAVTVANYMRQCAWYSRARFMLQGWGSSQPLLPNDSPEQRRKNRRVEILIYYRE
jgi:outer membrane protein OmpA-like peptidoglycan-associated protein